MRLAVAAALGLVPGCSAIFGLEAPRIQEDAPTVMDDAAPEDAPPEDSGPTDMMPDMVADAALVCPITYTTAVGTSRYRVNTQNRGFLDAAIDCGNDGSTTHLAVITSQTELTGVVAIVGVNSWIGLSDRVTEGTYLWVTTEDAGGYPPASGAPWMANQPEAGTNRNCTLVTPAGEWFVDSCGLNREYICECDAYVNDATRY